MQVTGTYVEEININKQLTILGPNAGVNPNTGTRTAEAVIIPSVSDPTFAGPFSIAIRTSNTTFSGFTLDGNNPALTSGVIRNGVDVDGAVGIEMPDNNFAGINNPQATIANNIIRNYGELGIDVLGNNAANNANSTVQNNKIDNIPGISYGGGIYLGNNGYANVTGNVLTRVSLGIITENFSQSGSAPASVSNNQIQANRIGIRHNLHYTYSGPGFTISNNAITSYIESSDPDATRFSGIRVESIDNPVPVTFSTNTITIPDRAALIADGYTRIDGFFLTNTSQDSQFITITANTVSNALRGISQTTPAVPTVTCNNLFRNDVGIYVGRDIQFQNPGDPVSESYATGGGGPFSINASQNNIVGNTTFGVQVDTSMGAPPLPAGSSTVAPANAANNYWGAADGPGPVGPGSGDKITTNVVFTPFLTAPQTSCAGLVSPPTAIITQEANQDDPTNNTTINFTVTFSEPVTGFDSSDVVVSGTAFGTGSMPTAVVSPPGNGTIFNVAVTGMNMDGTVIINVPVGAAQSTATNAPTAAATPTDNTVTFDTTAPTVTIAQSAGQPDPTNTQPISFTVVFTDANTPIVDFDDASDITLSGTAGNLANATISITPVNATTFTVLVSGLTTSGTVTANVAAGVATDAAGNPNAAAVPGDNTVTLDVTAPTPTISQAAGQLDPATTSPVNFAVVFDEAVTGFNAADVAVSGTAFGANTSPVVVVTGSGTTYNVAVSGMNQDGTVVINIAAGAAVDNVNNQSNAAIIVDNTVTFDLQENTVEVTPVSPKGWFFSNDASTGVGSGSFVEGPDTPPLGDGSARLTIDGTARRILARTAAPTGAGDVDYRGVRFDQITALSYGVYQNNATNPNPGSQNLTITFQFDVDDNVTDGNTAFQGRLVYEAVYDSGVSVQQNMWQILNLLSPTARFYGSSGGGVRPVTAVCNDTTPCTRAQLLAAFPNVGIRNAPASLIILRAGGPFAGGFDGNTDALMIGVNSANRTFDFEPDPPTVSIGNATVTEGDSGSTPANFVVTLSAATATTPTNFPVTVNYATANGTATAGSDYTATSGTLTFAANTTTLTQTITVPTLDDAVFEGTTPENFTITLSGATNATIPMGSETATGTIADNDSTVQFDPDSYPVTEGGTVTITVTRTGITSNAVSVNYGVGACTNSATVRCADGSDYTGGSGTLNFAAGETSKTFTVSANADINIESIETLNLVLTNAMGGAAVGTPSTATVLISDGNISISGVVTRTGTGTGVGGVTVSLTGTNSATTITTTTAADGTYSFAGLQSGRNYLVTPTLAGNMFEPTERNYLNLTMSVTNANFVAFDGTANPRTLSVVDGFTAPGGPGFVTINLNSQGNENAFSFSLDFNDTNQLDVALNNPNDPNSGLAVTCGADAPAGCTVNASVDPSTGNLSVDLMLPSGQAFVGSPGCTTCNRRAVRIGFVNKNTAPTAPTFTIPVRFTDVPTFREVFGTGGNPLPARYIDGVISVRNLESDVGPRKTGDGRVTTLDSAQASSFVARLETPDVAFNEFQRADSFPVGTSGNGRLTSGDSAQATRYAAGLDPVQPAAGPTAPTAREMQESRTKTEFDENLVLPRVVRVDNETSSAGSFVTVDIRANTNADENAYGFSIAYDPMKLSVVDPATDIQLGTGAVDTMNLVPGLTVNPNFINDGKIGFLIQFAAGRSIKEGTNVQLLTVRFKVASNAPAGLIAIDFGDDPIEREVVGGAPLVVRPTAFAPGGGVLVGGPTSASATIRGRVRNAAGRNIVGATVTLTDSNGGSRRARTNPQGLYRFDGVTSGATYTISASYRFLSGAPQTFSLTEDSTEMDIVLR